MLKVLVIGYGSIGKRYCRIFSSYSSIQLNIHDPYVSCHQIQIPSDRFTYHSSLPDDTFYDLVLIATPPDTHLALAARFLHSRLVLVEKPLALTLPASQLIAPLLDSGNIYVVANMRFHPGISFLKSHISSQDHTLQAGYEHSFTKMRNITNQSDFAKKYLSIGNIELDCIHEFDYLAYLYPDFKITSVTMPSGSTPLVSTSFATAAVLKYATININYLSGYRRRYCRITSLNGSSFSWSSEGLPEILTLSSYGPLGELISIDQKSYDTNDMYVDMLLYIVSCLESGAPPDKLPSIHQAYNLLQQLSTASISHI